MTIHPHTKLTYEKNQVPRITAPGYFSFHILKADISGSVISVRESSRTRIVALVGACFMIGFLTLLKSFFFACLFTIVQR